MGGSRSRIPPHLQWRIQDFSGPLTGEPTPEGGANLLFGIIFAENCMKMEKKWTKRGAHVARTFLDPPLLYGMCQPNNLSKISKTPNEIEKFWGVPSSGSGGGRPCEISHKKDGCQRQPHRFHVFLPPPPLPSRWIRYCPPPQTQHCHVDLYL